MAVREVARGLSFRPPLGVETPETLGDSGAVLGGLPLSAPRAAEGGHRVALLGREALRAAARRAPPPPGRRPVLPEDVGVPLRGAAAPPAEVEVRVQECDGARIGALVQHEAHVPAGEFEGLLRRRPVSGPVYLLIGPVGVEDRLDIRRHVSGRNATGAGRTAPACSERGRGVGRTPRTWGTPEAAEEGGDDRRRPGASFGALRG